MHIALNHVTTYQYDDFIDLGPQIIRLRPAPHSRTPILSYSLKITPHKHFINWQQDPHGNFLARLVFPEKTNIFNVEVDLIADMTVINPFDFFLEDYATHFPFDYESGLKRELKLFLEPYAHQELLKTYVASIDRTKMPTIDFLVALSQKLNQEIQYLIRMEPGVQTPEETLQKKSGSCRDSAWLMVNILRSLGLAARFVSGYLIQLKSDQQALDGPVGAVKDFTDLHAWVEVYLPGAGWIGLDATSGLLTGEGHIPLVATPDPSSASPISGSLAKSKVTFQHEMSVTRFYEDPRVTKPYTPEQWENILSTGRVVDQVLIKENVQLTMGGEPTFVSIDDMEDKQWNTEALGDDKRRLTEILLQKLKQRWTQGALVYKGQGKWYPGETLPRYVVGCFWRKDGKPIWRDAQWFADETKSYAYKQDDAKRFIETLAKHLNVSLSSVIPGYEDVLYYLWKEKKLPANVDPLTSQLKDEQERARLSKIFEDALGSVVGYALPISPKQSAQDVVWTSGLWQFRTKHMFLVPGDSPMGLRMPLDSLPWASQEDLAPFIERDPLAPVENLSNEVLEKVTEGQREALVEKELIRGKSAQNIVRTALCVEVRKGALYIFLPPIEVIESYLDLITQIEKTAAELRIPVVIEGYAPPYDGRIESFKLTPDPGVIEVNVPPTKNWEELVLQTTSLYEEARLARLGTEKFMLDGKHTGTGGGNHIVLGGSIVRESPFLKRPDLLSSMVAYWNNHPSLSYLFSGQFIGPTSQAPRVDEGRRNSIDELEIAMQQVEKQRGAQGRMLPWMVDRLFRHLLVDMTGNTHRAEFCIDKLFSPDSTTGRLGLVELRGFEMPPHPQMSIAQQLLIRALVAKFWQQPYTQPLMRWGTTLHDRFLLPHFVREDFQDVLSDLNSCGFDVAMNFFLPHFEFRFPIIGSVTYHGITLELRSAIEPWYVLGEEPNMGTMARYVDSSIERMQVKIKGMSDDRYILCCNGHKVPLQNLNAQGEYVAGIRYRAWQPASCLHPTIPVHTPLTFDIIDTWTQHAIGGCEYRVVHPGGRNYETFPVNALEAEARRSARFLKMGHTPGMIKSLPEDVRYLDHPFTLDLRKCAVKDDCHPRMS